MEYVVLGENLAKQKFHLILDLDSNILEEEIGDKIPKPEDVQREDLPEEENVEEERKKRI